jgi:hypothetical protein
VTRMPGPNIGSGSGGPILVERPAHRLCNPLYPTDIARSLDEIAPPFVRGEDRHHHSITPDLRSRSRAATSSRSSPFTAPPPSAAPRSSIAAPTSTTTTSRRRRRSAAEPARAGWAPNYRGCIYVRSMLFCQMLACDFNNHHAIGEPREMSTRTLPAASLRTGNLFSAGRAPVGT